MDYVVGIDSGGTNYRVMACGLDGKQLGFAVGKPANHQYLAAEQLIRQIEENIDSCLAQFGGRREQMKYMVCGTTGIDSEEDVARLQKHYESIQGIHCPIRLLNDAELAHYTVTGGEGVLIISGTGSIVVGVNKEGKTARAGGWPLVILGDEGSGTWVSKMALRHYARWLDKAVEPTPLTDLIRGELHVETRDELIQMCLKCGWNPAGLPQLGSIVNQAAAASDPYADSILRGAAEKLFHLIEDIAFALDLKRTEPDFCLGVWGSNLLKSEIVLCTFREKVAESFPQARICLPQKEAIEGAVELALKLLNS